MKKYQRYYLLTALIVLAVGIGGCNNQQNNAATTTDSSGATVPTTSGEVIFDKLVGTWQNTGDKSFERWTRNSDGTYRTVVFKVNGSDTSYTEENSVYQENGKWVSENKVSGQNDGKSVKFTQSAMTTNTIQLSNPAHDFPTDIHYTVVDANTVNAYIVGPNSKGGKDTIPFNYTRVR
ncbi:MAG TPA: hypothetical protein VD993_03950 [Chitinophagaceae bacterium]|nr:hypothetical protein [Chitinophagaceae bacterium]